MGKKWNGISGTGIGRINYLEKHPDLGDVVIGNLKWGNGKSFGVTPNSLGVVAWIYDMKYTETFPSLGNDSYSLSAVKKKINGKVMHVPGSIDESLFQNVLRDNNFVEVPSSSGIIHGDLAIIRRIPGSSDYGCFDTFKAGVYVDWWVDEKDMNSSVEVFGLDDDFWDLDATNSFGYYYWSFEKMPLLNMINENTRSTANEMVFFRRK